MFQLNIAQRWYDRGNRIDDPFAKFFFYFSGFNALYFLWTKVDDFKNEQGKTPNETKQIQHLLCKFGINQPEEVLAASLSGVNFFSQREPVQRMDRRASDLPDRGAEDEGRRWRRKLTESSDPGARLMALGAILYIVRSNLVHGSKAEAGDDRRVVEHSVEPLRILLHEAIELTKRAISED